MYFTDPLTDPRWDDLVSRHNRASAFHPRGWLESLSRTYGYQVLALTTAPPGKPMTDGVVFCRISSWITGTRIVSLPFADHCEPLIDDMSELAEFLKQAGSRAQVSTMAVRGNTTTVANFGRAMGATAEPVILLPRTGSVSQPGAHFSGIA